jgi:hypothetical protein
MSVYFFGNIRITISPLVKVGLRFFTVLIFFYLPLPEKNPVEALPHTLILSPLGCGVIVGLKGGIAGIVGP